MASAMSFAMSRGREEPVSMQVFQALNTVGIRRCLMVDSLNTSLPKMEGTFKIGPIW
jgi:hypothetical protein